MPTATTTCSDIGRMGRSQHKAILVGIDNLRPTQMAVGMRSVKHKRRRLEGRGAKAIAKLLNGRPIPAVRGPGDELYIIDNHHFGLALWHAEVESAFARVIDDKSSLSPISFWRQMEAEGRLYPFDEEGRRVEPSSLPQGLHELRHDPYRDLAWEVREAGGFIKARIAYAEFQWANFFRDHIRQGIVRRNHDAAIEKALKLCRSHEAASLPGYIAPRK